MKVREREEAVKLREQGLSLSVIAKQLGVSSGTVSDWVKDVPLTDEQKAALARKRPSKELYAELADRKRNQARRQRMEYREIGAGRAKSSKADLYSMGCMLYWAEGTKSRCGVTFANSDPNMIKLFMRFLRECFEVPDEKVTLNVYGYIGGSLSQEEIEKHWLEVTGLPHTQLRKGTWGEGSHKKQTLFYGTAYLSVNSTEIVQQIFGSICEFGSISEERWLD
jgi:predicted transcriptional regulator